MIPFETGGLHPIANLDAEVWSNRVRRCVAGSPPCIKTMVLLQLQNLCRTSSALVRRRLYCTFMIPPQIDRQKACGYKLSDAITVRKCVIQPMQIFGRRFTQVRKHPGAFALNTLKAFRANQGLLLAGAVAYYALLSIVPMLILTVIALSHFVEQSALLQTLGRYLEWLVPGQSNALVSELANFLAHRDVLGWVLLGSMIFFSSLAFTVLENAMSVIFHHRVVIRRRHFLISAVIPYGYILSLGLGVLLVTLVAGSLQALGQQQVEFLWRTWSLGGLSGALLYLLGFMGEVLVLTSVYLVMPVGRPSLKLALFGAFAAAVLWELSRHALIWYFATLSQIGAVYGSLTTAIAVLLSLEVAAALLLMGAQVISEYEQLGERAPDEAPQVFTTPDH